MGRFLKQWIRAGLFLLFAVLLTASNAFANTQYHYGDGILESIQLPTGEMIRMQYDPNGNLLAVQNPASVPSRSFDGTRQVRIEQVGVNTTPGGKNTVAFWMYWDGTENVMPFAWKASPTPYG